MELIDRAALGVGRCSKDVLPTAYCAGWNGLLNIINDAPTIDAVPVRHGRWYDKGALSCRCSECGCKSNRESNYCPNCGALMKEAKHEAS